MASISTINPSQKTDQEIESSISNFLSIVPRSLVEQTFPCYSGYEVPVNYSIMRPIDFIGPLEYEILPDSPVRKVMWLANLCLNKQQSTDFILTIPFVKIIKNVHSPEYILFPDIGRAAAKDCFDEAFEDNDVYQQALRSEENYGIMRSLAFQHGTPRSLLTACGYKEVAGAQASKGDLIIYFFNGIRSSNGLPVYSNQKKISHYGRIIDVANNGTSIVVKSRFNHSHVYQHPIDCIPYYFGNSYLIFTKAIFSEQNGVNQFNS